MSKKKQCEQPDKYLWHVILLSGENPEEDRQVKMPVSLTETTCRFQERGALGASMPQLTGS
ncbi:uncharacterized protein N7515_003653 [Penicillium bovifimosum]|uniref:Uncharacterized protein n=1 Tax=Penicillium bovifimosum TaxID=126998 RepID=A0A9W9H526_9EURO|nr:uncharacterized protein N7515_003653 [Penicillium bovifimosum]KAJ5138805.1 hypothetical protein N7515_003653 [Penicillium bovifimosum]